MKPRRSWQLSCLVLLGAYAITAGHAIPVGADSQEQSDRAPTTSFALYTLSRGRGVPEPTRKAWHAAWAVLEDARRDGKVVRLEQERIGLEGEMRLCVVFDNAKAAREMLGRVRSIVIGVELLNLMEEPCSRR
jgi:hypothetical protein